MSQNFAFLLFILKASHKNTNDVNGYISNEYEVKSGVPRESHIGFFLFNIFKNEIALKFKAGNLLYGAVLKNY